MKIALFFCLIAYSFSVYSAMYQCGNIWRTKPCDEGRFTQFERSLGAEPMLQPEPIEETEESQSSSNGKCPQNKPIYVQGHYRDGHWVQPHCRSKSETSNSKNNDGNKRYVQGKCREYRGQKVLTTHITTCDHLCMQTSIRRFQMQLINHHINTHGKAEKAHKITAARAWLSRQNITTGQENYYQHQAEVRYGLAYGELG